jgi:hypothetical protein
VQYYVNRSLVHVERVSEYVELPDVNWWHPKAGRATQNCVLACTLTRASPEGEPSEVYCLSGTHFWGTHRGPPRLQLTC